MQWIQMVLTSFQRHSALSLHAKCKHTLICMSLLTQTLSVLQYITNKHSSLFTRCDVVLTAVPVAGGAAAPGRGTESRVDVVCLSGCAAAEHLALLFVPWLRQSSDAHSRMHLRQGWGIDSTASCTQPLSPEAP